VAAALLRMNSAAFLLGSMLIVIGFLFSFKQRLI
jgi:hypothetical protein